MKNLLSIALLLTIMLQASAQQAVARLTLTPVKYDIDLIQPLSIAKGTKASGKEYYYTKSSKTAIAFTTDLRKFSKGDKLSDKLKEINAAVKEQNNSALTIYNTDGDRKSYTQLLKDARKQKQTLERALYESWTVNRRWRLLPARNESFARAFYGSNPDQIIEPLRNNYLAINNKSVGIYSEFFSGFAGPLRYSIGGFFSRTELPKIDTSDFTTVRDSAGIPYYAVTDVAKLKNSMDSINNRIASLQNLLSGGGNLMVILSTPLLDVGDKHDLSRLTLYGSNKFAMNIPGLSNGVKNVMFLDELSADLYFSFNTSNFSLDDKFQDAVSIYIHGKAAGIFGSKQFMSSIDVTGKNAIAQISFEGGISILQNIRLFGKYTYTSDTKLNSSVPAWNAGFSITPTSLK